MRTHPIIRMQTIDGIGEVFDDIDIISASLVRQVSPLSIELPASEVEFTIYTTDTKYSIFSDGTYYTSLSQKQPLDVFEDIDGVEVFIGRYYLDEWKFISESQFWFKGIDIVGLLEYLTFDGRFYEDDTALTTILDDILSDYKIEYQVLNPVASTVLRGWIAPGTAREALQQALFAAGAMVYSSRSSLVIGESKLVTHTPTEEVTIGDADKKGSQEIELMPMVTKIDVVSHEYVGGGTLVTIFDRVLEPGSYKLVFDKPYYGVTATGEGYSIENLTTEGGENLLTEGLKEIVIAGDFVFGPNYIYLTVGTAGQVLVQGYEWIDSEEVHTHTETLDPSIKENQIEIRDATMVSSDIGDAVLNRVVNYFSQRYRQRVTLLNYSIPDRYYGNIPLYGAGLYEADPSPRTGDIAMTTTFKSKYVLGIIEKEEVDLTGGFLVNLESVGVEA